MAYSVRWIDSVDSTNLYLKTHPYLPDKQVIATLDQTAGRGRLGRGWDCPKGGLAFSILEKDPPAKPSLLPLLSGVALSKTMEKRGYLPSIKWPNDVYLSGKKAAGILVEGLSEGPKTLYIVGIGVNLNQDAFPSLPGATSLFLEKKEAVEPEPFLEEFLSAYEETLLDPSSSLAYLREHDFLKGKRITLNYYGEGIQGKSLGIDEDGELLLLAPNGDVKKISSGEASLLRMK